MRKNTKSLLKKAGAVLGIGLISALASGAAVYNKMDDNYGKGVFDGEANIASDVDDLNDKLSEVDEKLKLVNSDLDLEKDKTSDLVADKEALEKELAEKLSKLDKFDDEISLAMNEDLAVALVKDYIDSDDDFSDDLEDRLDHDVEKILSVNLVNIEVEVDEDSGDLEAEVSGTVVVKYEDEDEKLRVEVLDVEFVVDGEVEEHSFL